MFTKLKVAIVRAITCDHLAESIRQHTEASNALLVAIREHSVALLTKTATIDSIEESAKYLAASERRALQRTGNPHEF